MDNLKRSVVVMGILYHEDSDESPFHTFTISRPFDGSTVQRAGRHLVILENGCCSDDIAFITRNGMAR